jgi:gluconate 2-dehydrogenase gamma chain
MNRRDLLRNTLLTMGAVAVSRPASARVFPFDQNASVELARAGWKPVFLDEHQNETLIALSDAIIPATDTPGAKEALVNRFLDLVLSSEPLQTQHDFLASLAWLDTGAMERYKVTFLNLTPEERNDFLDLLAWPHTDARYGEAAVEFVGNQHFSELKDWISEAFYSSPTGLKELGWNGSPPSGLFSGCEHSPADTAAHKG